jgi:hypothetical protein
MARSKVNVKKESPETVIGQGVSRQQEKSESLRVWRLESKAIAFNLQVAFNFKPAT